MKRSAQDFKDLLFIDSSSDTNIDSEAGTFTNVNYTETDHRCEQSDSTGAHRKWTFDYIHSITQSSSTYEVVSQRSYMAVGKTLLDPHIDKLETVKNRLMSIAYHNGQESEGVANEAYVRVAENMKTLYLRLKNRLTALENGTEDKIAHTQMLVVLKQCEADIDEALNDDVYATHRGFSRNTPILRSVCAFLDILKNFFAFLDKKIANIVSRDNTPVFASPAEFSVGMFKPAKTGTLAELDKLKTDIQWYCREIEAEYKRCDAIGESKIELTATV